MFKRYAPQIGLVLIVFLLGGWLGYMAAHRAGAQTSSEVLRENSSQYKFTNPLLLTLSNTNTPSQKYDSLHSGLKAYIQKAKDAGNASDISVYFRNMNDGNWTGVNENDQYAPGSMLKVIIMMGYLKQAESEPSFLDRLYSYNPQIDEGQYFKPAHMLPKGQETALSLIENMIIESDNTAAIVLADNHGDLPQDVYNKLDLPPAQAGVDFMSAKEYSLVWRVLYNATYLSHDNSEEALHLLSLTTFKDGLVAGLPAGTPVAHKFGEHTDVAPGAAVHELHDCGIVYATSTDPYFLCVMTRGSDFPTLESAISDISKLVYHTVVPTKPN